MAADPAGIWLARPSQPRQGRPLAVKDIFHTTGLTTTYGSAVYADHVPPRTATAVQRLEQAGWANVGKTNLHEFAYGVTSQNPHYGTVPNPLAPGRVAGGSSGGNAAALAIGSCEGALGTDSGGSIRIPAAWCGVVGFKPSFGLVSMEGCFPLAPSFDHAGPMARDVATCAAMMRALVPGFEAPAVDDLAELRIGVCGSAAPELGESVDLPSIDGIAPAFMREVAETHAPIFDQHSGLYGDNVRTKVERCLAVTDAQAQQAARRRQELREQMQALWSRFDVLVTPTVPMGPPPLDVDELDVRERAISLTFGFNAVGAPALALGSLQIAAAPGKDALVLAAGELIERGAAPR